MRHYVPKGDNFKPHPELSPLTAYDWPHAVSSQWQGLANGALERRGVESREALKLDLNGCCITLDSCGRRMVRSVGPEKA